MAIAVYVTCEKTNDLWWKEVQNVEELVPTWLVPETQWDAGVTGVSIFVCFPGYGTQSWIKHNAEQLASPACGSASAFSGRVFAGEFMDLSMQRPDFSFPDPQCISLNPNKTPLRLSYQETCPHQSRDLATANSSVFRLENDMDIDRVQ